MSRTDNHYNTEDYSDFDDYRYDNTSRRTVRAGTYAGKAEDQSGRSSSQKSRKSSNPSILYDARGVRVKKSWLSSEFAKTLIFFVIPYLVINTIVFLLVTSTPKIEISISETDDYKTAVASFTISSLLPLKETVVTLESEQIEFEKSGNTYTAQVTKNGTFYVEATSANGMRSTAYTDVSILDDTPPTIDDSSCHIDDGVLSFTVADPQSGINWKQIYGLDANGNRVTPTASDQKTGIVQIPMLTDTLELHVPDLVGNERTASITLSTQQLTVTEEETTDEAGTGSEAEAEAAGAEQ